MSKYVCSDCQLVQEANKNPYLRVSFQKKTTSGIMQDSGKPVVLAMSGSFFTNNQPDHAKNLAWCQERVSKYVGQEVDIDPFTVDVEPYYKKVNNGTDVEKDSVGNPVIYTTITVNAFSEVDLSSGGVKPYNGWDSIKRQGKRMLDAGVQLFITAAKYNQFMAARAAVQQPQQQPQVQSQPSMLTDSSNTTPLPF